MQITSTVSLTKEEDKYLTDNHVQLMVGELIPYYIGKYIYHGLPQILVEKVKDALVGFKK